MNKSQQRRFCLEYSNNLRYLGKLLYDYKVIESPKPLEDAATECQRHGIDKRKIWEYDVVELIFVSIDPDRMFNDVRPTPARDTEPNKKRLVLSSSKGGPCVNDYSIDPFNRLSISYSVSYARDDGTFYTNSWHIDKHIRGNTQEISYFPHPDYHIQYGGHHIAKNEALNFGDILLIDAPRIPIYPMDIVLCVEYLLSNYYGNLWYILMEDDKFRSVLSFSIDRFLRPYIESINTKLQSPRLSQVGLDAERLLPLLR